MGVDTEGDKHDSYLKNKETILIRSEYNTNINIETYHTIVDRC